jgi:hypothetical protein
VKGKRAKKHTSLDNNGAKVEPVYNWLLLVAKVFAQRLLYQGE